MIYSQQFKICYCPVAMKNIILEYESHDGSAPKCLNGSCTGGRDCPYRESDTGASSKSGPPGPEPRN